MERVPFYEIELSDGFWKDKQKLVYEKTVDAVYERFSDTGRIETMNSQKSKSGEVAHVYWASDVFKWIEGVSYFLEKHPENTELRNRVERIIDDVEKGTADDGYYNSHFNCTKEPRFSDRSAHELYTIGHMIEAGVAYRHATKDERFFNMCRKNADVVYKAFLEDGSAAFMTPGHEEIELALVKLYDATGDEKYLRLSEFFVRMRGNNKKDYDVEYNPENDEKMMKFCQSHLPIEKQDEAAGHAVRGVYFYSAVADLAKRLSDKGLEDAAKRIFDDIYEHKMYITGGIGMSRKGEAFGEKYDLPNDTAYAETCAALGLALFGERMYESSPSGKYGDAVERAIYNGMIAGLSLDGEAFFYENPLEFDVSTMKSPKFHYPTLQRKKVFDCSCCPPNIVRMVPSIANLIYSYDEEYLYVHQYIANESAYGKIVTEYPGDGKVYVKAEGKKLALRLPYWCDKFSASEKYTEKDGYLYFDCDEVSVDFEMKPKYVMASPDVHADIGKLAVTRGPIVYCIESKDQCCSAFRCAVNPKIEPEVLSEKLGGLCKIKAGGFEIKDGGSGLYRNFEDLYAPCELIFIPYYTYANRGIDDMRVFVNGMN